MSMTNHAKFQLCLALANEIVSSRRAKAHGDPVNTWVAIAGTAISVGVGAYQANKASKAAKAAQSKAASVQTPQLDTVKFPDMPPYVPNDFNALNTGAVSADEASYGRTTKDFKKHNLPLWHAEILAKQSALNDQKGDSIFIPQVQNEFVNAGVGNALDSFGDTGRTLAPGSAGEANVARNLGISVLGFQDRNRANRNASLALMESIFPRREIGLNGTDATQIALGNNAGQNAATQAAHAQDIGELQYNERIKELNVANQIGQGNVQAQAAATAAQADAQAKAAQTAAYAQLAQSAITSGVNAYGKYNASPSRYGGTYQGISGSSFPATGRPVYRPTATVG